MKNRIVSLSGYSTKAITCEICHGMGMQKWCFDASQTVNEWESLLLHRFFRKSQYAVWSAPEHNLGKQLLNEADKSDDLVQAQPWFSEHLQCCNFCKTWKSMVSQYQQQVTETRDDDKRLIRDRRRPTENKYVEKKNLFELRVKQDPTTTCNSTACMNHKTTKTKQESMPLHYPSLHPIPISSNPENETTSNA